MADETRQDENRDPVTGEQGSHPVGAGLGAAGGGAAGVAIGAAVGGPVGAVVGAVVGGVVGAYGGKGVAEAINPTHEHNYWREKHAEQPFADKETPFEHYEPAYRTGIEAVTKYAGRDYAEIEDEVALDYERNRAGSPIPWDQARHATRAAWSRLSGTVGPRDADRGLRGGL